MSPATITIMITVLMALMFLSGKFPFGLTTMTCCVLLVLTGVLEISDAFGGLSNKTIVMVAAMFALSTSLQKTNLALKLKGTLLRNATDHARYRCHGSDHWFPGCTPRHR